MAIKELSEWRGFDSVSDYANALIDADAKAHGIELPPATDDRLRLKKKYKKG